MPTAAGDSPNQGSSASASDAAAARPPEALPAAPPSPGRLLVWAGAWAVVGALGATLLVLSWPTLFEASGQRTIGLVVTTPGVAVVLVIVCLTRAALAVGPARHYRARWSAHERAAIERARLTGQPSTPFIVFALALAAVWLAGVGAVLIFLSTLLRNPAGLSLAIMLLALIAMLWIPALQAGLRRRRGTAH